MPAGIAVARDGAIYVTDIGAQTIRRIANGMVGTLAGTATIEKTGSQARGGYADGPARVARFSRPEGIAVAADGSVYVADTLNHCIRRIRGGMVSTFAGSIVSGTSDGTGAAAHFGLPKGLAFDGDGNLYVADSAVGIRKITAKGVVTTLDLPMAPDKLLTSISVRGSGASLVIAYTDTRRIYLSRGAERKSVAFDGKNQPWDENETIGYSFGVAIVGDDAVAVTDLSGNDVKYVRFDEQPFFPGAVVETFAPGRSPGQWRIGGRDDGPSSRARMNAPFGIAMAPDGSLIVADSGNRSVRAIRGLDARAFVRPDMSDLRFRSGSYRIMMLGDSYMFANVMRPDSLAGIVENGLSKDSVSLRKPPDVEFASIAGMGIHAAESLIDNDFADGESDVVVLVVDEFYLLNDPNLGPGDSWRAAVASQLRELSKKLAASHTAMEIVVIPQGQAVSPSERLRAVEMQIDPAAYDFDLSYDRASAFEQVFASSGVHCVPLLEPLHAAAAVPSRGAFYNSMDHHLTPEGTAWIARYVLGDLERWAPWKI